MKARRLTWFGASLSAALLGAIAGCGSDGESGKWRGER